ncbi:hypothetical protein F4680DRAFT_471554 [Xylaria scruposa]|nr:hypothetical protein F4680DRAFT_471554 [Xylaria scruposa]
MPSDLAFGRLQASLAQATQDFTIAAANFNFDFTLVKVEAPPEYRDIATALSPSRVHEAETGCLHVTARRLGALFEGVCPKTPNLIRAYGLRASEISLEVAKATRQTRDENWIRMQYGGIDATSIWAAATSIIAERKREILAGVEQGDWFHPVTSSAVQQEITREQLSKWDSSTRAWLQSADSVRQKQYKQFLLIAQNVNVAIHDQSKSLYSNVLRVWTNALSTMESLILGRPHVVRDAPVLLGLSAWHIFPDMVVFNGQSGSTTVQMDDALIKDGGVLSLGFSDLGPHEHQGVYWSLSLAHHTFYGKPTLQTRRLDSDGSRLSLDEFILIPIQETGAVLRIIQAFSISMSDSVRADFRKFTSAISRPFKAYNDGNQQAVLAASLGRRRPNFIPAKILQNRRAFFQLAHLPTLLYPLRSTEHKIQLLRRLASRVAALNSENSIILCFNLARDKQDVVFASACAKTLEDQPSETSKKSGPRHHRWIERPKAYYEAKVHTITKRNAANDYYEGSALQRKHRHEKLEYLESNKDFEGDTTPWFHDTLTETVTFEYSHGSYGYLIGQRDNCESVDHNLVCEHGSLYCRGYGNFEDPPQDCSVPELTFEDVLWCFESGLISSERLETVLRREAAFGFLQVLSAIYSTYEDLAACGATICSAIVNRPFQPPILGESDDWLNADNNLKINRYTVLRLIGYFATAEYIDHGLKHDSRVIGLGGGDSIFVLSKLVNDPGAECSDHSFTIILGNTGHPGFFIFCIPANLRAREIDPAAWRIEPSPFDDTYVDYFKSTSLHLGFTEWCAPVIQVQSIGQMESKVNLIEAIVSVRDSGRWVADVDINAALSPGCSQLIRTKDCTHSDRTLISKVAMLSIKTWDQVLDVPDGSVVVRSSNNWLARLALVSVLRQHSKMLQRSIVIWQGHLCQQCIDPAGYAIHIC